MFRCNFCVASQEMDGNSLQLCTEAAPLKTGDRLTVLHSRLHQEADKIRKWKTATDIELRQKVCIVLTSYMELIRCAVSIHFTFEIIAPAF